MKKLLKYIVIFAFSGLVYILLELLYRQRTDITMFLLAGMCGLIFASLNNIYTYELDFSIQVFIAAIATTIGEYIFGVLFNTDYHIWDYRNLKYNINGFISLEFVLVWIIIAIFGIPLLDYIEWRYFDYKKDMPPYYKVFGKKIFQFKMK